MPDAIDADTPAREGARSWRLPAISFYQALFFAYLAAALLLFTFLVPPFQKSDEPGHFYRAVSLTNFDLACKTDASGRHYFPMKRKYPAIEESYRVWDVALHYNVKFDRSWLRKGFSDPVYQETVPVYFYCSLPPLGYLPNAAGVLIGKPFTNPLVSLYAGRLAGALFFLGALIIALRITPERYRILLYLYAALPAVLHQVSAISYDVAHLSLLPLIFAYLTRFIVGERPIKLSQLVIFAALLLWLINIRLLAFAPLLLLFFVIDPSKIALPRPRYLLASGAFLASAALTIVASMLVYYPKIKEDTAPIDADPAELSSNHLRTVLDDPWHFAVISFATVREQGEFLMRQGIAGFGWQDYGFDYFTYYVFFVAAVGVLLVVVHRDQALMRPQQLAALFAAIGLTVGALFLSAYVSWSPINSPIVLGLQGRYFLVLLPLAILALSQLTALAGQERMLKLLALATVLFVVRSIFHAIDLRYYD